MSSNNRRAGGIPIPSFATAVDVSPSVDGSPRNTVSTQTVPARWKVASLLQLEVSLQHWFHKQGPSRGGKITLDEFYTLVRKLDWSQLEESTTDDNTLDATGSVTTTNDNANDKPTTQETKVHPHDALVADLTKEERLLHDLVCLTANPTKNNTALYKIDLDAGTLEPRESSAEKLKRLMASTKFLEESWSSKICAMIQKHREKKIRLQEKAASLKDNKNRNKQPLPTIQAIITKDMTVDERVRARVKAKQQNEEQSQQQSERDSNGNSLVASLNNDRTWLIQLADALNIHARNKVQQQNRNLPTKMASNSLLLADSNNNNSKRQRMNNNPQCILTFKDAIDCISKSRIGEASATQIAKALTELATYTPKYITVFKQEEENSKNKKKKDRNNDNKKQSYKWSRTTTTIIVRPDRYRAVRCQLTGEPMPTDADQKSKINIVTDTNPKTTMAKIAPATTTSAATADVPNRKRASPVLAKNLLDDFAAAKANDAKRVKTTATAVVPSPPAASSSSYFSTSKATSTASSLPNSNKKREHETMAEASLMSSPTTMATSTTTSGSPNPKQKKRLRINWENVIIEEDRTGGIVLPPSERLGASPRSLNSLFRKLKKGERI